MARRNLRGNIRSERVNYDLINPYFKSTTANVIVWEKQLTVRSCFNLIVFEFVHRFVESVIIFNHGMQEINVAVVKVQAPLK